MVAALDRTFCERAKYDVYLPDDLLRRSFVADHLDVPGAAGRFREVLAPDAAGSSRPPGSPAPA